MNEPKNTELKSAVDDRATARCSPWKRFYFESNQFFDHINDMDDWDRLRKAYPDLTDDDLLDSKEATYNGSLSLYQRNERPNYGMRLEHDGGRTLRDFFIDNNMSL